LHAPAQKAVCAALEALPQKFLRPKSTMGTLKMRSEIENLWAPIDFLETALNGLNLDVTSETYQKKAAQASNTQITCF